ncbi:exonuclease [Candidatus Acetothermia bacterium]|nr:exonuclease [Candidatus Acetothermia bacterium]
MQLLILDGAESVGGTKLYLQSGAAKILIDFGLNYKTWGRYFEEYLQPRAGRGLHDLLKLGVAPAVSGIYRPDLFPKGFSPAYASHFEPTACFVSHAHLDHCGLLGLLQPQLPLYASPISAAIMKAMQDIAQVSAYGEMAYTIPRVRSEDEPRAIESSHYKENPAQQRAWHLFSDKLSEDLELFLSFLPNPSARARKLKPTPIQTAQNQIGPMKYRVWPVDHSIPGACAFAFETDAGWVVYSGDVRLHGAGGHLSERFAHEAAKLQPILLILEGTRARPDEHGRTTEQDVYENSLETVRGANGKLILADFGPRHIERLLSFLKIAQETNRQLLVLTKDIYLLKALTCADPRYDVLGNANLGIFDAVKVDPNAWEARVRKEHQAQLVPVEAVHRNPGDFILAFSFWDLKHLLDIDPPGGVYLYSSSEAYTEEQEIDIQRLFHWLDFFKLQPVGMTLEEGKSKAIGKFHASGHATGPDLLRIARTIQPKKVLPVHTEHPEFFVNELGSEFEILRAKNGDRVTL